MKLIPFKDVELKSGYLYKKQDLNSKVTINSVYDRFYETGRIGAFDFNYKEGDALKPDIFWDSDVAKWMEGACYILKKQPNADLEAKVDALVAKIKENQCANGYFNIYYTVCEPEERFKHRERHELYCAGHLMEAAVAYSEATGKNDFLECMERYADHIKKVFVDDKSSLFISPGHEEIELALIRMYLHTKKKKFLDLATHFINVRGTEGDQMDDYDQSHLPVREQTEAKGHAVRAVYLYTGMALLSKEAGDAKLFDTCKALWDNIVFKKMYVTGGLGSTHRGEAFTFAYDLPNDTAYNETCADIGLMFFAAAMLRLENDAKYADVIERVLYNGVLSGMSLDGRSFFYENPLEINTLEHIKFRYAKRRFPITQRLECFECSCCPPNINRLLPSLGNYIYATEDDMLFVNQYISSDLSYEGIRASIVTEYPNNGNVVFTASGISKIAFRIPSWCDSFTINKDYEMLNGYAIVANDGSDITIEFAIAAKPVFADPRVIRNAGRVCFMRGPIVYCAEAVDNPNGLHSYKVSPSATVSERFDEVFGLMTLTLPAKRLIPFDGDLYSNKPPKEEEETLKLIPFNCFANRGESDMLVWLHY